MNYCSFPLPQVQGNSSEGLEHPITYPSLMSCTHARKRPHSCQDQLSVFGFYQLQQQADPIVLENPLSTRFFPPQDYEVVCSLGGRQELGVSGTALPAASKTPPCSFGMSQWELWGGHLLTDAVDQL